MRSDRHIANLIKSPQKAALIIAGAYFCFALLWIIVSGVLLMSAIPEELSDWHRIETIKDASFIFATSLILFFVARYFLKYLRLEGILRERRSIQHNLQLQAAEDEILNFTRKMSHDLKAPIRSVHGFSQAVADDYGHTLDPTAIDYLNRIRRSAERMDNLVSELVDYSRLRLFKPKMQAIDFVELSQKILRDHYKSPPFNAIRLKFNGFIPPVYADTDLLYKALYEVYANAGTFVETNVVPEIEVSCKEERSRSIFTITDNGIGIPIEYHASVFNIFTRLHGVEVYPGLGIGLAVALRCMNKMGGQIYIDSESKAGTSVILAFPKPGSPT